MLENNEKVMINENEIEEVSGGGRPGAALYPINAILEAWVGYGQARCVCRVRVIDRNLDVNPVTYRCEKMESRGWPVGYPSPCMLTEYDIIRRVG